jgi:hypothetical protein
VRGKINSTLQRPGTEEEVNGKGRLMAGATVNGFSKDFSVLSLPGSKDESVAKIPTRLLPGLQAANAGDGELGEFSQQQQFPPRLIICGSAIVQVAVTSSGQPCNELVSSSKIKTKILEMTLGIYNLPTCVRCWVRKNQAEEA